MTVGSDRDWRPALSDRQRGQIGGGDSDLIFRQAGIPRNGDAARPAVCLDDHLEHLVLVMR